MPVSTAADKVGTQFAGGGIKALTIGATTSTTAVGTGVDLRAGYATFAVQATGLSTGNKILLQGSLDGANWGTLGSTVGYTSTSAGVTGSTSSVPVQFVRLNAVSVSTSTGRDIVGYIGCA